MSHRAIQRLREERNEALVSQGSHSDSDDEEEDDNNNNNNQRGAFGFLDDSSSDDSSSAESSDREEVSETQKVKEVESLSRIKKADDTEDLDALLEEFKIQDEVPQAADKVVSPAESFSWFEIITGEMDVRDLDFDFVMRSSLLSSSSNRRNRQFTFGPPKDGWPRPPSYIAGGIGFLSYDKDSPQLPWPYCDMKEGDDRCPVAKSCFQLLFSDSYSRDCQDYRRVCDTGDANMLAVFLTHHPFSIECLLQLSSVCYQTNQSQEGLSLLQRALYVFEAAFPNSFKKHFGFMDYDIANNSLFFLTLSRMVRVCHVAGLPTGALAFSRLLLSLDCLRDPMNTLILIDHFCLLKNTHDDDLWLVKFFESEKVTIYYREESSNYECSLACMPNWLYSVALALYRINQKQPSPESERKAKMAMKKALSSFPSVFTSLLEKNEVDIPQTALRYADERFEKLFNNISNTVSGDSILRSRISQVYELMINIFISTNYKLYTSDVLHEMLVCVSELATADQSIEANPFQPALLRYASVDPANFQNRFQRFPDDANPLDRNLVARALR